MATLKSEFSRCSISYIDFTPYSSIRHPSSCIRFYALTPIKDHTLRFIIILAHIKTLNHVFFPKIVVMILVPASLRNPARVPLNSTARFPKTPALVGAGTQRFGAWHSETKIDDSVSPREKEEMQLTRFPAEWKRGEGREQDKTSGIYRSAA